MDALYTVYAIKSLKDGRIYVGFSDDADRRLAEHNAGVFEIFAVRIPQSNGYLPAGRQGTKVS